MQAYSLVALLALLCVVYVAQSAGEPQLNQVVDGATKDVEKRSIDEHKRGFRPDLGKRDDVDDDDDNGDSLRQSLKLLTQRQERARSSFRGDLGKRRSFRGDLGKRRRFRGDLGKRADIDGDDGDKTPMMQPAEKRPFRGDLGKRRSSFRGDLGKRGVSLYDDEEVAPEDGRHGDFSKRRSAFRGDLGKRRASFRGDLGK